jgi:hypothetical protein
VCENHSGVRNRPNVSQPDGPAQFLAKKLLNRFSGKNDRHRFPHDLHSMSLPRYPIPQLEIVGMMIGHRFPTAYLRLILSDSNPTSHTMEVMASRTGRSQSLLIIA